jgi:N-acyl-D-amino-acid deacylase
MNRICLTLLVVFAVSNPLSAEERATDAKRDESIAQAVERGLKVVQTAARSYPKHRQCFSCHHQTLPLLGMVAARRAGFEIDEELLKSQLDFTRASFEQRRDALKTGQQIGGRAATVSYGLWTLEIADAKPDALAADMVTYLLKTQDEAGFWKPQSTRPPLEESHVSCTVLSAYGLVRYAPEEQQDEAARSVERAKTWLASAKLESQEDKNGRLWGLHLLGGTHDEIETARRAVLEAQREDGGWSQLPSMTSDAYATGQTLFILRETGLPASEAAFQRGIDYLLKTQQEDGSWLVETRSKPIQLFFDNGDPHGKHQFISVTATGWAVAALAKAKH